jgi:hypothetical protein
MTFDTASLVFFAIFGVIVTGFIYRIVKYSGFKSAMFGGHIERTLGEVEGTGQTLGSVKLRVHTLSGGGEDRAVGRELVATTIGSYQMLPITLSVSGVDELVSLLRAATSDNAPFT